MTARAAPAYLIVNADDYGHLRCVSRGILECARHGIVTATGVFGNAAGLAEQAAWARECDELDTGVHLNLTAGEPITDTMRRTLSRWSGRFPAKFALAAAVLARRILVADVRAEWTAQIERCMEHGLRPRFLNSHEHIHMLPPLFPVARELAATYGIDHLRLPAARFAGAATPGAWLRASIMKGLELVQRGRSAPAAPRFLGLGASGRLSLADLEREIGAMRPGAVHELMCHPGRLDADEVRDPRLLAYHDWEGETRLLTSAAARALLDRHGVRLIGYRHLERRDGQLTVRSEAPRGH